MLMYMLQCAFDAVYRTQLWCVLTYLIHTLSTSVAVVKRVPLRDINITRSRQTHKPQSIFNIDIDIDIALNKLTTEGKRMCDPYTNIAYYRLKWRKNQVSGKIAKSIESFINYLLVDINPALVRFECDERVCPPRLLCSGSNQFVFNEVEN